MIKGKYYYFKHPVSKAGYESALRDYLNLKAELNYAQPYMGLIKHHLDIFQAVQKYFDQTAEQTTRDQKLSKQVDQFINWLEQVLQDPSEYFPEPDLDAVPDWYFDDIKQVEEWHYSCAVTQQLKNKKEFKAEFIKERNKDNFYTLNYELSEDWKEKTTFSETKRVPQTVGYWIDDFLNVKATQALNEIIEISTYRDAAERLGKFRKWIGEKTHITKIGSETVKRYHSFLTGEKYANRSLYFQFFKTFVSYCAEDDNCALAHLPNNINSRLFVFRSINKKKLALAKSKHEKLWTKADIQRVIAKDSKVPQRYQCWILLMLNCAMTQSDLNDLKREEIDLKKGRIIRIRKKAEKYPDPPVVNYKLWDTTLDLLKKEMEKCTDDVYALQASFGARIISERIEVRDGNTISTRSDNASRGWQHVRKKAGFEGMQLKYLKKSGVTALTENIKLMHLDQLYLGHSHRTIADRNYNSKGGRAYKPLDKAIKYIGKQFGLK